MEQCLLKTLCKIQKSVASSLFETLYTCVIAVHCLLAFKVEKIYPNTLGKNTTCSAVFNLFSTKQYTIEVAGKYFFKQFSAM